MPLGQRMGSMGRTATISRKTRETDIRVELCLDGSGTAEVGTGLPFFIDSRHMVAVFYSSTDDITVTIAEFFGKGYIRAVTVHKISIHLSCI